MLPAFMSALLVPQHGQRRGRPVGWGLNRALYSLSKPAKASTSSNYRLLLVLACSFRGDLYSFAARKCIFLEFLAQHTLKAVRTE
jgi:hypothetical protein